MPELKSTVVIVRGDSTYHSGPGWYSYDTEYPDEGSDGPYARREQAFDQAVAIWGEEEA